MVSNLEARLDDYVSRFREYAKRTEDVDAMLGFTVGLDSENKPILDKNTIDYGMHLMLRRPEGHAFIHFHTTIPDDLARGLSPEDTTLQHVRDGVYDYYVVANTHWNEINIFENPRELIASEEYREEFALQIKDSTDAADLIYHNHHKLWPVLSVMLQTNHIGTAIKFLRAKDATDAAKCYEGMFDRWGRYMVKVRSEVIPITILPKP